MSFRDFWTVFVHADSETNFRRVLVLEDFDYCFAENGLTAYRKGVQLPSEVSSGTSMGLQSE